VQIVSAFLEAAKVRFVDLDTLLGLEYGFFGHIQAKLAVPVPCTHHGDTILSGGLTNGHFMEPAVKQTKERPEWYLHTPQPGTTGETKLLATLTTPVSTLNCLDAIPTAVRTDYASFLKY